MTDARDEPAARSRADRRRRPASADATDRRHKSDASAPRRTGGALRDNLSGVPDAFWTLDATELEARLGVDGGGLSAAAAKRALKDNGLNRVDTASEDTWWRMLLRQFISPIEIILIIATALSWLLGDWTDAIIIVLILLLSGLLGFAQEHNAGKTIRTLISSVEVTCTILRDGHPSPVAITRVAPGDVAQVSAGDLIPGDCLVLAATGLTVDESALTGETFPVEKGPDAASADSDGRRNAVFFGTHATSGTGTLLVVRTGARTQLAAVAASLTRKPPQTGFEKGMTQFGLLLTRTMIVLVIIVFVINLLLRRPPVDSALFSLALAVGLTPQLLPAIVAISLAHGARAMSRQRVIVRRLDAIEDIGSMTILCSDKTGTMTQGRVRLESALDPSGHPDKRVAELAALNAALHSGWENPIDQAITAAHARPAGFTAAGEVPYDFLRKRQSVLVRSALEEVPLLITKGAVESVLEMCTNAFTTTGTVPLEQVRRTVESTFANLSGQGFRVLAVATKKLDGNLPPEPNDENGATLAGLLAFTDPVKPDAAATIAGLAGEGVSVRMITGDNRLVAEHVSGEVGLDATKALTGADTDAIGDAALAKVVMDTQVFCEMNPVQKERVVRAFRHGGHVVGYLGDGINDAPSLHAADVGVTVESAAPVARQSAAIVMMDKELGVLLEGIRQGRRTFANTTKYIFMTTSANFGNMLSMAVAAAVLPFLPLLAAQILLVNLLTDVPGMAIASDAVDKEQLRTPQKWDLRLIRTYMLVFGAVSSAFDLVTFAVLRLVFDAQAPEFRSAWLLGSVVTEVGVLFILRSRGAFWRSRPGVGIVWTSGIVVAITVWLPYSPVADWLELVPLRGPLLFAIASIALLYFATNELVKRAFWARHARRTNGVTGRSLSVIDRPGVR